ncbi:hypothetical protein CPLU01_09759 [Colletotrichum plurivorum]|uniref:Ankyrin repeat protein n=1 Tax=Colletotrichum plurivorum TaxID=2175906 RepID=A0A8H6K7S7_9PEZI|nr:hypothetical protein CPLU01_09759 [Colletotrichum plurivorum]
MPGEVIYENGTPYRGYRDDRFKHLSPLHLARSPEMIKMIISLAPDIPVDEKEEANGDSILSWLIYRDMDSQGIRYLLEAGAHPDCIGPDSLDYLLGDMTPLETALALMNSATVKVLEYGTSDFLRFLVNAGANPHMLMSQGHTSIRGPNFHSHSSVLQAPQWILKQIELLQSGQGWFSTLYLDEDTGTLLGKLKVLLETHPQLSTRAALYTFAIRNIEMKFLEEVLRVINLTRSDFRCPWGPGALARLLHRGSVLRGHLGHLHDCVLLLLRTGANVNNCHKGKTALHRAFSLPIASPQDSDDMDVEHATVDWDPDWDDYGFFDRPIYPDFSTEEHAALRQDDVLSIVLSLLLNGADPKAEDNEKKTPAWYAKKNGWLDLDLPKAVAISDMVEIDYAWKKKPEDHPTCYEITGEWD